VWGAQGENCAQYLSKGRPVAIDGRLEWSEWEAQDGGKRSKVEVVADTVQFLGSRSDKEGGGGSFKPSTELKPDPVFARPGGVRRRYPLLARSEREPWHPSPSPRAARPSAARRQARPHGASPATSARKRSRRSTTKNYNQLRRYMSEKGKIRSRRISGACRRHQRQVAVAIKRAREMALLPYAVN